MPQSYNATFPRLVTFGTEVKSLGEIITDDEGRLIVLRGYVSLKEMWLQRPIKEIKMRFKRYAY
ncbi:hypothetical protein PLUTE_b0962 [Pseudoalteromonas luteoviolacea DSM 6061]|nr:hypothetical protein [Pseudoalteromonas luteoviolacea DSM 6061]